MCEIWAVSEVCVCSIRWPGLLKGDILVVAT